MYRLFKIRFNTNGSSMFIGSLCICVFLIFLELLAIVVWLFAPVYSAIRHISRTFFIFSLVPIVILSSITTLIAIYEDEFPKENKRMRMENLCQGFWDKEFHRVIMHDDWAKIYAYASEFSKIFKKYAYFYICTDTFHDLPLQQLERALNILAERNPEYFTEKLIETVLSDTENGLENTYLVDFSSEETLEIKKMTDDQIKNDFETIGGPVFSLDDFLCCCIGVFMPLIMIVFWVIAI